jgi:hypothetical protein
MITSAAPAKTLFAKVILEANLRDLKASLSRSA